MIITFCGHSNYLSCSEDEERLIKLIETVACGKQVDFYLGGYGSFDSFALKCATRYKQCKKNAKLVFVCPNVATICCRIKRQIANNFYAIIFSIIF